MNIIEALDHPDAFAPLLRDPSTWMAWRAFLGALFALPMDDDQLTLYRRCTGRTNPPAAPVSEAWLCIGRRGGKSFTLALIAVFLAAFRDYTQHLGPGERATVMVIAADRKQARVIMRYVKGILSSVPMLAPIIEAERQEAVDLRGSVTIEVHTASFRTVRGYTIVAALCDEIAFWPTDDTSSSPDTEIVAALRPAMVTIPGAVMLCSSSPYARRGALWNAHHRHHGVEGDPILVWQADTRTMNPTVPQAFVDAAYADDPASAPAEFGAQFRSDIEGFVTREVVDAVTELGCRERAPVSGISYIAFVDPSGGSSDAMTLAIGHRDEEGRAILDALRERRPPFSPADVVKDFSLLLEDYRINKVQGDRYAGEWPREVFGKHHVKYEPAARPKSELYRDVLPLLNSAKVSLLDIPRLAAQLVGLERRTTRSGRDSIDHAPGSHDDAANAVAGLLVACSGKGGSSYTLDNVRDRNGKGSYLGRYQQAMGMPLAMLPRMG